MAETDIAVSSSAQSSPTCDERAAHVVMMIASPSILAGKLRSGKIVGLVSMVLVVVL